MATNRNIKIKEISGTKNFSDNSILKKKKKSRKKKFIIWSILILLILGLSVFLFWPINKESINLTLPGFEQEEIEKNLLDTESPLNGIMTTKEIAKQRPLAVMIENHPDSRPQSGLNEADLVYEMITEGGITRFLAFYLTAKPKEIGPIRSARVPFVGFAGEYNACYAHVGGSAEALTLINKNKSFCDLNQFSLGKYFWRDKARYAPHNVYTTVDKLKEAVDFKKYSLVADYDKWVFKDDAKEDDRGQAQTVSINFSSASYKVNYDYNKKTNTYLRKHLAAPHKDRVTSEQIKVKTIIVQEVVSYREGEYILIKNTTSGKATIYLDGKKINGTWKKLSQNQRTKFYDEKGQEMAFNRGPIWIEIATYGVTNTNN